MNVKCNDLLLSWLLSRLSNCCHCSAAATLRVCLLADEQELRAASAARGLTSAEQMATGTSSSLPTPAAWTHRLLLGEWIKFEHKGDAALKH